MKYFSLLPFILLFINQSFGQAISFTQTTLISSLNSPVAFEAAPNDSRIFITLKGGIVQVYNSSGVYMNDFYSLSDSIITGSERGLLGLAFDPDYATNKFVYFYYNHQFPLSTGSQAIRVIRFTDNNSHGTNPTIILNIPVSNSIPGNHVGGNIHFRPSDHNSIYVAIGELATPANAQTLANPFGKILRINKNGTIPSTNPFYDDGNPATGNDDRIWEYGHRNPFEFTFSTANDSLYIAENGENVQDELNLGRKGGNYGWRICEGNLKYGTNSPCSTPGLIDPLTIWTPTIAITGVLFYTGCMFPELKNHLVMGDYNNGRLYNVTLGNAPAYNTATGNTTIGDITTGGITCIKQGTDGSIYVLNGGYTASGKIDKLTRTIAPVITANGPTTFCQYTSVPFTATPSGYDYQWLNNNNPIPGASLSSYAATVSGIYSVSVCNHLSNTIKTKRLPSPKSHITVMGSPNICAGDSVLLQANENVVLAYQWRHNGKVIKGVTSDNYWAKSAGVYRVKETNVNNGCNKVSGAVTINVTCRLDDLIEAGMPYPNPFSNSFTLNLEPTDLFTVEVIDLSGRKIISLPNSSGTLHLGDNLNAGMYLLNIRNENGKTDQYKLVKMD